MVIEKENSFKGFGSWSVNVMNAGNGNLSITYDGLFSGMALNGTTFANNTSIQCLGGLTTSKGKFTDESGFSSYSLTVIQHLLNILEVIKLEKMDLPSLNS